MRRPFPALGQVATVTAIAIAGGILAFLAGAAYAIGVLADVFDRGEWR